MLRPKILIAIVLLGLMTRLWAQSSVSYQIPRQSVDTGAAATSSVSYQLLGTIGQPDAGVAASASYALSGGFYVAVVAAPQPDLMFANGFE